MAYTSNYVMTWLVRGETYITLVQYSIFCSALPDGSSASSVFHNNTAVPGTLPRFGRGTV